MKLELLVCFKALDIASAILILNESEVNKYPSHVNVLFHLPARFNVSNPMPSTKAKKFAPDILMQCDVYIYQIELFFKSE